MERNAREACEEREKADAVKAAQAEADAATKAQADAATKEQADTAAKEQVDAVAKAQEAEVAHSRAPQLVIPLRVMPPAPENKALTGGAGDNQPALERGGGDPVILGTEVSPPTPTAGAQTSRPDAPQVPPVGGELVVGLTPAIRTPVRRRATKETSAPRPLEIGAASSSTPNAEATSAAPPVWTPGGGTGVLNRAAQDVQAQFQAQGAALQQYTKAFLATRTAVRDYQNIRAAAFNSQVQELSKRTTDLTESRRAAAALQQHLGEVQTELRAKEEECSKAALKEICPRGVPLPDDMLGKSCLLYRSTNKAEFVESMPSFDERGMRPDGLVGPRENPVNVVPFSVASAELAPDVDAGGRAPPEAGGMSAGVQMPPGAPGALSSGTRDSPPGKSVAETMQTPSVRAAVSLEKRPPPPLTPPPALNVSSRQVAPGAGPAGEVRSPSWRFESAASPSFLHGLAWSLAGVPRTPPLVMDSSWLALVFSSSSSSGPRLAGAPREAGPAPRAAPSPSPLSRGGAPLHIPPVTPVAEDEVGRALEFEHGRSVVRHELFQEAMSAMNRLSGELTDVDAKV
nr:actin cytoskeleton-regulatory complex protein PAN1-like [Aegilops tauschii subsp. strangulata]